MKVKEVDIEKAIKTYNGIMETIGYEYNTINTKFSESTEGWNLRDMVAECEYALSTYCEDGHCNGDMRHSKDPKERQMWKSETKMLKNFIDTYKPYIHDLKCAAGHCSSYDN